MSGLRDLSGKIIKISDSNNLSPILNLILGKAQKYDRIGSYFSSGSFVSLAEGLAEFFLKNGKMRLIINYELQKEDYDEIKRLIKYKEIEEKITMDIKNLKSEIELNSAKVLGWLIDQNKLEIRVVTGNSNNLMHIKQGILEDEFGNMVAFTGSANETYSAYEKNIEQVTFFKNWEKGQEEYVNEFLFKFNRFWEDYDSQSKTYSLATAFKKGLIKIKPKSNLELKNAVEIISKDKSKEVKKKPIIPRPYQKEAVNSWINNKHKGIIEMPTGCGKTKTAFFCYKEIKKLGPVITLIFAPTRTICNQWAEEFKEESCKICKIYNNSKWKSSLKKEIIDMRLKTNDNLIIIGTYALMNSSYLLGQLSSIKSINKFLIADEVHSTGAAKTSEGLVKDYNFRLGLSATPKRWLDEGGTARVFEYFNDVVFDKITLYDAIYDLEVLCEYNYHLIHVILNGDELEKYNFYTKKIMQKMSMKKKDKYNLSLDNEIQRLAEKRANIIKNCDSKIEELTKIIDKIRDDKTIIFVSPDQREKVLELIKDKIRYHQFTYSEKPKIRAQTLNNFKKGAIKCIVAIKCLDEGLDIPSAKIGVLMASSGNPREFIQRRGRLLRRDDSKKYAEIFDFFVTPPKEAIENSEIYKAQIEKELKRISEFSKSAKNELGLSKELKKLKEVLRI